MPEEYEEVEYDWEVENAERKAHERAFLMGEDEVGGYLAPDIYKGNPSPEQELDEIIKNMCFDDVMNTIEEARGHISTFIDSDNDEPAYEYELCERLEFAAEYLRRKYL